MPLWARGKPSERILHIFGAALDLRTVGHGDEVPERHCLDGYDAGDVFMDGFDPFLENRVGIVVIVVFRVGYACAGCNSPGKSGISADNGDSLLHAVEKCTILLRSDYRSVDIPAGSETLQDEADV